MADHREFAERFKLACDRNPNVPPHGQGQQVWFRDRLGVSQKAVRKWLAGLAKPKPKLLTQLAHLLDVDEAWLAVGKAPEMTKKQEKQYREQTEGAVYLVFGLFMSAGYSCAFRNAAAEALGQLYEVAPEVDIFNLTDAQIGDLIGYIVANDICNRVDLQLGQTYEKLKFDARQIQLYRNDIKEYVNAQIKVVLDRQGPRGIDHQRLASEVLASTLEVFVE